MALLFRRARELRDEPELPGPLVWPFIVGEWPFGLPLLSTPIAAEGEELAQIISWGSSCQLAGNGGELISTAASAQIVEMLAFPAANSV